MVRWLAALPTSILRRNLKEVSRVSSQDAGLRLSQLRQSSSNLFAP